MKGRPGRKRKFDPTIPKHVDQSKIPTGLYWDGRWSGSWYVFDRKLGERPKHKTVAGKTATLADLHAIAEARAGKTALTILRGLAEAFASSDQFKTRSENTRADYAYCQEVVCNFKLPGGRTFGDLTTKRITRPVVQGLIDALAGGSALGQDGRLIPTPSKAAHAQRYLHRLFEWGANRGFNDINPAAGIEMPTERKRRRLPELDVALRLVQFARAQAGGRGKKGSVAAYLWAMMLIGYRCRLRPIEVRTLTDAHETHEGIHTNRRKGSRDNITEWSPDLREAWDYLVERRRTIWADEAKPIGRRSPRPVPIRAEDRFLVVNHFGKRLVKSSFYSAWSRLMERAIEEGILKPEQAFGMHDLKRRGVTDTPGTRPEKQLASGHVNEHMLETYDFSLPTVRPAGVESPIK